jgi:hypothetical protein
MNSGLVPQKEYLTISCDGDSSFIEEVSFGYDKEY